MTYFHIYLEEEVVDCLVSILVTRVRYLTDTGI